MLTGVPFFSLIQVALCLMAFWVVWSILGAGRGARAVWLGCLGIVIGFVPLILIGDTAPPMEEDALRLVMLGGAAVLIWSLAGPAAIAGLSRIAVDRGAARGLAIALGLVATVGYVALLLMLMQVRG